MQFDLKFPLNLTYTFWTWHNVSFCSFYQAKSLKRNQYPNI